MVVVEPHPLDPQGLWLQFLSGSTSAKACRSLSLAFAGEGVSALWDRVLRSEADESAHAALQGQDGR